jgi:hypothetical protein
VTDPVGSAPDARHHEVEATAAHREALRRAGIRGWWRRTGTWVRVTTSALALTVVLTMYDVAPAVVVLVGLVVPAALVGLARLLFGRGMDRRLAVAWADGARHATVFDAAGFAKRGPSGVADYPLAVIRSVHRSGDVVEVRLTRRGTVLVPAELFPVEEEERMRAVPGGRGPGRFSDVTRGS